MELARTHLRSAGIPCWETKEMLDGNMVGEISLATYARGKPDKAERGPWPCGLWKRGLIAGPSGGLGSCKEDTSGSTMGDWRTLEMERGAERCTS